jgi:hypothetical protein
MEVERFDRHGEFGRSAVCTWAALDAALFGMAGENWSRAAARMLSDRYISADTQRRINRLWHFGRLIANSDMHEETGLRAGAEGGRRCNSRRPTTCCRCCTRRCGAWSCRRAVCAVLAAAVRARGLAGGGRCGNRILARAAADERISAGFRAVCKANGKELKRLRELVA